jgi:hypothetical protein
MRFAWHGVGQRLRALHVIPTSAARCKCLQTVSTAIATELAISRWLRPHCSVGVRPEYALGEPKTTCRAHAMPACGRPLEPGWTFACGESSLRVDRRPTWTPSSLLDSVHFGSLGRYRST